MMHPTPQEIERVLQLDAFARYEHSIKKIADTQVIYFLANPNGLPALSTVEKHTLIALWPFAEYAELCRNGNWSDYQVTGMSLTELSEKLFPLIVRHKYLINVLPANGKTGFVVHLEEFLRDLKEELSSSE